MAPLVLVVEDDADIRDSLCRLLEDVGCSTVPASNGQEALARLRWTAHRAPCLILLDIMMPVMDGLQFLAERQRDAILQAVPVVVMTAGDAVGVPKRIPVLRKPLRAERLIAELSKHCSCRDPRSLVASSGR
jgi:CheY-like chemotaxis protein